MGRDRLSWSCLDPPPKGIPLRAEAPAKREKWHPGKTLLFSPGKGSQKAREAIRKHVEHLDIDRPLYPDHNTMKALVKSGEILEEIEKVVGELD